MLRTFISNVDNLPGARFFLRNDDQAGLIVQNTVMVRCFGPERYRIPVCDIFGDLHDGPWFDRETLSWFLVACGNWNVLGAIVCEAYAEVEDHHWRSWYKEKKSF